MYLKSEFVPRLETSDTLAVCISAEFGLCVISVNGAPEGAVLDHFTGDISPELTQHSLQVAPGLHISNTRFIGYLSHGCDPNCRLDMTRFELTALRDIAPGELLTIDYAETEDVLHVQFACHCGARRCRQWITGRHDLIGRAGLAHLASLPQPSHGT
jgi:hypothetical protein